MIRINEDGTLDNTFNLPFSCSGNNQYVYSLDFIENFKNNQSVIVIGSSWPKDEQLIVNYINQAPENVKFIIAPHNIKSEQIAHLKSQIQQKTILFSEKENQNSLSEYTVFIIDTIGILTKIYSYADIAYVGGGFGNPGVHNILEPATFGIPVVIGNKYQKFKEAVDLVRLNGCISISNQSEFSTIFTKLNQDKNFRLATGNINKKYIQEHLGATQKIMNYLKTRL